MKHLLAAFLILGLAIPLRAQQHSKQAIAFYTGKKDLAHISFVREAIPYFYSLATRLGFKFDTTTNWSNMNPKFLARYQLLIFLDSRPEDPSQRQAFERYMRQGGAWLGFHFSGFALTPSDFNQDWSWYHNEFMGAGEYKGNTWRPTSAVLRTENRKHPAMKGLPARFLAAPNEWYSWTNNLRLNRDIRILLSIDPSSFPLGTGPKQHEIWHSGDYPVAWTNRKYRMIYFNVGHNDMDYGGTNNTLSSTFSSPDQDRFINQSIRWLLKLKH